MRRLGKLRGGDQERVWQREGHRSLKLSTANTCTQKEKAQGERVLPCSLLIPALAGSVGGSFRRCPNGDAESRV